MLYKDGMKDVDKYEMIRLWQIPEVKEMLTSEIQRILGGEGGKAFGKLQLDRENWFRELYEKSAENAKKGSIYWFELTRYQEDAWRIIDIIPYPVDGTQPYYIVTGELMKEMADYPVKPGEIFTLKKNNPNGEIIFLRFIRQSTTCIMGSISFFPNLVKTTKKKKNIKMPEMAHENGDEVKVYIRAGSEEMEFRTFYRYLYGDFERGKKFMRDFLVQRLPDVLEKTETR